MENADYYGILGLARTAEPDDVKEAYRRLAKLRHPDKNPNDPNATANFQALNDAYATLSDSRKRQLYDAQSTGPKSKGRSRHNPPSRSARSNETANQSSDSPQVQTLRRRRSELSTLLRALAQKLVNNEQDLSSAESEVKIKRDVLERLQEEQSRDEYDQKARRGLHKFLRGLSAKQQEERDSKAAARRTDILATEAEIKQLQSVANKKSELLESIRMSIHDTAKQKATVDHQYEAAMQGSRT